MCGAFERNMIYEDCKIKIYMIFFSRNTLLNLFMPREILIQTANI